MFQDKVQACRRAPLSGILSLISCLNRLRSASWRHFVQPFETLYSRSVLFKHSNNLGCFSIYFHSVIYETKLPTRVSFLFSIFYLSHHFNFSFDAETLPFVRACSHVITLPVCC